MLLFGTILSVLPIQNINASSYDDKLSEHKKTIEEKKAKTDNNAKIVSEGKKLQKQLDAITKKLEQGKRLSTSEIQVAKKAMMESSAAKTAEKMYDKPIGESKGQKSYMTTAFNKMKTETITSKQDPGQGHESHQVAMILSPRDVPYDGAVLAYSASKSVQLVSLMGPLADDEIQGQMIWTPDGKTKYAITIVDGSNMGVWTTFSGNALALHSSSPEQFTASYTVVGLH